MDFSTGATSILVTMSAAATLGDPLVKDTYRRFLDYRETMRDALLDRLGELRPKLDGAIDAVEAELRVTCREPAGERHYVHDKPIVFSPGFHERREPDQAS